VYIGDDEGAGEGGGGNAALGMVSVGVVCARVCVRVCARVCVRVYVLSCTFFFKKSHKDRRGRSWLCNLRSSLRFKKESTGRSAKGLSGIEQLV
jgi:hypothetical protein